MLKIKYSTETVLEEAKTLDIVEEMLHKNISKKFNKLLEG